MKTLLNIICIITLNECSYPKNNSNKPEWLEETPKDRKLGKLELFKNNNLTEEPIPSTSYNLPETLDEEPKHYIMEKLTLNPNAVPYEPIRRCSTRVEGYPTSSEQGPIPTSSNEEHVGTHSNRQNTIAYHVQPSEPTNEIPTKIPPFLREMQQVALKCNVPIHYEPFSNNYPDFVLISYDILVPKYWSDPQIVITIAFYKSSGELLVMFHPEWLQPIDVSKYWNGEYLEGVNPEYYRSVEEVKQYFATYAADKFIVSFKIGKVLSIFGITIPDYRIRDLKNLNRFTFAESPYVSKLEDILAHFLVTDATKIKHIRPMLFDTKAHYMRKLFLSIREAWENEIAYYFTVKKAYGNRAKHFSRYFKNQYAGLQLDARNNPERAVCSPPPKYLYGMHTKRYEKANPNFLLISIYDSSFNLVMKTMTGKSRKHAGEIFNENLFSGPANRLEQIAIEKLTNLPTGFRPIIVGFDIYKQLKMMDVSNKLAGCAVYDTKEIFEGRTVCELAVKYAHLDYRDRRSPTNSDGNRSYHLCDEKMSTSVKARIAVVLFKLYSLSERAGVRPLIL